MKRIIICCDGTWNKPETFQDGTPIKTNVQRVYEGLDEADTGAQVKYYGSGVGTGYTLSNNLFGGAFGKGIDSNIQNAYKFLMWNYKVGDEIFLFGFSRGAYTVRSLAGLIRNCGILRPEFLHLVPEAYYLYRERTPLTHPESDLMKSFKTNYSIENETPVKFVGIWDTVGSLGIPISIFNFFNRKYQFHDVKLSGTIKYAYHALAIDEKRKIFEPTLWELNPENQEQVCEQVWFSGVHSNVGGGYPSSELSDITLRWMVEKAEKLNLKFSETFIEAIKGKSEGFLENSRKGFYKLTPKKDRAINRGYVVKKDPNTGKLREVTAKTNESVHYSCFERCHQIKKYKPKNFFTAVSANIPYDPTLDQWKEEWLPYLGSISNGNGRRKDTQPTAQSS